MRCRSDPSTRGDDEEHSNDGPRGHTGSTVRIEGIAPAGSHSVLGWICEHQVQARHLYSHLRSAGGVLVRGNIGGTRTSIYDHQPEEPQLTHRLQVRAMPDFGRLAA